MSTEQQDRTATVEERPATLTWALRLLGLLVLFAGVVVLVLVIREDDMLRSWAEGNESARRILETEGLEALKNAPEGSIQPPHFVAPAITLYGVIVALLSVLTAFLRNGFEWARMAISAVLVLVAICATGGILTDPPFYIVAGALAGIVIGVAALVAMWLPSS